MENELEQIVTKEILKLGKHIENITNRLFGELDYDRILREIVGSYVDAQCAVENNEEDWEFKSEYLNNTGKINCGMAVHYFNAAKIDAVNGNYASAIDMIVDAALLLGSSTENYLGVQEKSKAASDNALKRHAENHSMKEQAIKFYQENQSTFTSKDDAAMKIAGKIVPAKFATVRNWLKGI
jgi:hypothetical protein